MKNKLYKYKDTIVRVLKESDQSVFIIDCLKTKMPYTVHKMDFKDAILCDEDLLMQETNEPVFDISEASEHNKKIAYDRYNMIAPLLSFMDDKYKRTLLFNQVCQERNISKQSLRNYFYKYLIFQNICVLVPKSNITEKSLTQDEKNMRWALNKYFYSTNRYSLKSSYLFMLKEKYCDINGKLQSNIPSFYQFRYFYRKTKNMQTFYITRDGLSNYQRNKRPLLGDGIQEFAPAVGTGLLDATVCDIYLIDETNSLVGRPILTVCIDAYSSFCYGYALTWEGGIYSLKVLMQNMVSNKKKHCEELGIFINENQWSISEIPGTFVTDMGKEYVSENFEQITELGVTLKNLPPYRPELKGVVEKFFNIIQETYKPYLKNKGIVEPDFLERGVHDYRKDACLTIEDFEKIIVRCIVYYNSQRILKNFPYTEDMIENDIKPYANNIFEYSKLSPGANLIPVTLKQIMLTLLPRTTGIFSRFGLKVNKMRYKNENYIEKYLIGGEVTVAYNPDNVSYVWLIENGCYIQFKLIESRYNGKELTDVELIEKEHRKLVNSHCNSNTQAQIDLANSLEEIVSNVQYPQKLNTKYTTSVKNRAKRKYHIDFTEDILNG